jgi:hypothetical protein
MRATRKPFPCRRESRAARGIPGASALDARLRARDDDVPGARETVTTGINNAGPIATMHLAKSPEFRTVAVLACDDDAD